VPSRAPRRTPKQSRSRDTVDTILVATDLLVQAHGVAGIKMRMVGERAGIGMGTLYHYFATREALLAAWEERAFSAMNAKVGALIAQIVEVHPALEVAVFALVDQSLTLLAEHMRAYSHDEADWFLSRATARHEREEPVIAAVSSALAAARSPERLRPRDLEAASRAAVKTLVYFARDLATSPLNEECQRALRHQVVLMVVHMLVKDADEAILREDLRIWEPR
jgi:AcrR family transcriptional regulator